MPKALEKTTRSFSTAVRAGAVGATLAINSQRKYWAGYKGLQYVKLGSLGVLETNNFQAPMTFKINEMEKMAPLRLSRLRKLTCLCSVSSA